MAGSFSNSYNTNAPFSPETPFGRVPKEVIINSFTYVYRVQEEQECISKSQSAIK